MPDTREYRRIRLGRHQTVRAFSADDDALMIELRIAGLGTTEIAKIVGAASGKCRTQATINMRLKSLAAKEEYDADD